MAGKKGNQNTVNLRGKLDALEVSKVGVVSLDDCKGTRLEKAASKLLPGVRSVVVVAMDIYPEVVNLTTTERITGTPSYNEFLDRHVDYLNARLSKAVHDIARACHESGMRALPLLPVGSPADARVLKAMFSYKHTAEAAGLGKIGWSSLLITPEFGPRVRLACCLTEAPLDSTSALRDDLCNGCGICVKKCPAKALSKPKKGEAYKINKFACSTYRTASGGCIQCMKVCPIGK